MSQAVGAYRYLGVISSFYNTVLKATQHQSALFLILSVRISLPTSLSF